MNELIPLSQAAAQTGLNHLRAARVLIDAQHPGQALTVGVAAAEEFAKAVVYWICLTTGLSSPPWLRNHRDKAVFASFLSSALRYREGLPYKYDFDTPSGVAAFLANVCEDLHAGQMLRSDRRRGASEGEEASEVYIDGERLDADPVSGTRRESRDKLWEDVVCGWQLEPDRLAFSPEFRDFGLYSDAGDACEVMWPGDVASVTAEQVLKASEDLRRMAMTMLQYFSSEERVREVSKGWPQGPPDGA